MKNAFFSCIIPLKDCKQKKADEKNIADINFNILSPEVAACIRALEDKNQKLDFFNEAETYSDTAAPELGKNVAVMAHTRKSKRTKAKLTEGLEHQKILCELPEEQVYAKCGTKMTQIGEKYVRTELIIVSAKFLVVDYYVTTYKCIHCERDVGESHIKQVKAPVPVMKKSIAASFTVVYVMQENFRKEYLFTGSRNTGWARELTFAGTQWQTGLSVVQGGLFLCERLSKMNSSSVTL